MDLLSVMDTKIFHLINGVWTNPVFNILMPLITELGNGEILFLLSVIFLVIRRNKDRGALAMLLFAGLAVTYYIVFFMKAAVGRPRPFIILPDANIFVSEKTFSFPSTHAAMAFMAATVLSGFFASWRLAIFLTASLVCYSRIYMGVHFLSDVLGGALVGVLIGRALLRMGRRSGLTELNGA